MVRVCYRKRGFFLVTPTMINASFCVFIVGLIWDYFEPFILVPLWISADWDLEHIWVLCNVDLIIRNFIYLKPLNFDALEIKGFDRLIEQFGHTRLGDLNLSIYLSPLVVKYSGGVQPSTLWWVSRKKCLTSWCCNYRTTHVFFFSFLFFFFLFGFFAIYSLYFSAFAF